MNEPTTQASIFSLEYWLTKHTLVRACFAWLLWAMAATFLLFQFFLQLSSAEIVTGLMHSFSLTALGGGVLASAYYYIYVLLQAPAGSLVDRFGPRRLLSGGAIVVMLGCWLFADTHRLWLALVGRFLMGGGASFAFVGSVYLIAKWFPPKRFGLITAVAEAIGTIGSVVGGFYLAHWVMHYGWRECMHVAGFVAGIIAVFLWLVIRDQPPASLAYDTDMVAHIPFREKIMPLIKNPAAWANGLYAGAVYAVVTVFVALWGVPFLQLEHHLNLWMAALVCNMVFIGIVIGTIIYGWLDTRISARRGLLVFGSVSTAILLAVVIYVPHIPLSLLFVIMFLMGLFGGSYVITFIVANELAVKNAVATSIGFSNMCLVGLAPLLQPLIGLFLYLSMRHMSAHRGNHYTVGEYQLALTILPVVILVSVWLVKFIPRRAI